MNDLLAGGGAGRPDQQAGLIQSGKGKNITHAKIGLGDEPSGSAKQTVLKDMCRANSKDHSEADDDVLIANDYDEDHENKIQQHMRWVGEDGPRGRGLDKVNSKVTVTHPLTSLHRPQKIIGSEKSVCSDSDEMTGLLGGKTALLSDNNSSSSSGGGGRSPGDSRTSLDTKPISMLSAATTTAILSYSLAQQPPIASVTLQQPTKQQHPTSLAQVGQRPSLPAVTLSSSSEKLLMTRPRPMIMGGGRRQEDDDDDDDSKLWFQTSLKPSAFFREEPSKTGTSNTTNTHHYFTFSPDIPLIHLINTPYRCFVEYVVIVAFVVVIVFVE